MAVIFLKDLRVFPSINGTKLFVMDANVADKLIVAAKAADAGISLFLVDAKDPGIICTKMPTIGMDNTCEVIFKDVAFPKEDIIGEPGKGWEILQKIAPKAAVAKCAEMLGGCKTCLDLTSAYAKERVQFNRPISQFQINAFKLADMATEIELGRLLLYKACWLKDNGKVFNKEAAMAKLYCSEMMRRCANHAVQLHGGYGLMKEYDVERFYRDQKLLEIGEGTSEVMRIVIARLIGAL